jgi:hypothetical protein
MEEEDMGQDCSMYWDEEGGKKGVLTGKSEGKRPLRKLTCTITGG